MAPPTITWAVLNSARKLQNVFHLLRCSCSNWFGNFLRLRLRCLQRPARISGEQGWQHAEARRQPSIERIVAKRGDKKSAFGGTRRR